MHIAEQSDATSIASTTHNTPLTQVEVEQLAKCEQIIGKGLETYVEVGNALFSIQDKRLYRITHDTFEQYCREKWTFSARQANRLIGGTEVVKNIRRDQLVSKAPLAVPVNEAQARELAHLPPEKQVEAAGRVAQKKKAAPTAKDFREAAEEVTDAKPRITVTSTGGTKTTTGKASMEALIELIDEVQTMVRGGKPKEAVLAKLKQTADLATRINNGGRVC